VSRGLTAARSRQPGTVPLLQLKSSVFGQLPNFLHSFELIEYTGPLNYIPGTNRVSGSLDLVQTGDPSSHLAGAIEFLKSATNRFNELELQPGQWTNAAAQPLVFASDSYLRDELLKTNYYGYADFDDGDPNTADPDYYTWILSIDDANDADADSIPDFSDDPASTGPSAPSLGLSLGSTNLNLSISGTVGRSHEIQEISSLSQTNWTTTTTITLTNSPQVVSLPLPNGPTRFWRVRAL